MTTAVILAAGQGQRLKPLTDDRPKGMVQVAGLTIIERQLHLFEQVGLRDVAIVKGYCASAVPAAYGSRQYTNDAYRSTNMVCSLFCADELLASAASVIVSYGDILYSEQVLRSLLASPAPVSVVVDLEWKSYFAERFDDPYSDAESLVLGSDDRISSIGRREPSPEEVQAQYIGLIRFEAGGLAAARELAAAVAGTDQSIGWGRPWRQAYMTDLLQELVNRGVDVRGVPIRGGWCEIDSLRDHALAERRVHRLC